MPTPVKLVFSIVVLGVAFAGYVFLTWLEQPISSYLALFFGAFSVVSFWIFPEVIHKKGK
ncbi:MAG: hypothetical protein AAF346_22065 [Pseudomonadota bacterium]